ncbi:Uncharacterized membrane protein [Caminicella sporogenes DSM 14501]|uniref:Uncharacterized membrane protein n=1 Tax=Caminicella sporogenes DSM 14501 TaxID=1121266 RepID=A0A1M6NEQ9_9FIRM|nr:DUF1361 domain-containing protein [Caminicella sporogenes]RKD22228.1 hypothetical protein BET04_06350 [Caminicella sporogenes]SHJ94066.1 Uncharacterized membrane protein [Caminicella sporogenes DSM 14501]
MEDRDIKSILNVLVLLSIIGSLMVIARVLTLKSIRYVFLIWNIFLAWLPLVFSILLFKNIKKKRPVIIFLISFLWLIFYPNAPYIVTDIIHLSRYKFYSSVSYELNFNKNIKIWYDFILIMIFVFTGYILGFLSLNINHKIVKERLGSTLGWLFIVIISFLSGFAIYLGRFLRLNSWEIISNPRMLIITVLNSIRMESLIFSAMFGFFIFITYILFCSLSCIKSR